MKPKMRSKVDMYFKFKYQARPALNVFFPWRKFVSYGKIGRRHIGSKLGVAIEQFKVNISFNIKMVPYPIFFK